MNKCTTENIYSNYTKYGIWPELFLGYNTFVVKGMYFQLFVNNNCKSKQCVQFFWELQGTKDSKMPIWRWIRLILYFWYIFHLQNWRISQLFIARSKNCDLQKVKPGKQRVEHKHLAFFTNYEVKWIKLKICTSD